MIYPKLRIEEIQVYINLVLKNQKTAILPKLSFVNQAPPIFLIILNLPRAGQMP